MAVTLDAHQLKAVKEIKNGSILRGGVGSGKSRTAIAYFFFVECGGRVKLNGVGEWHPFERPRDLYIITTAKKRDEKEWESEAAPFGLSRERGSSFGEVQVTVDSWNNIPNYKEVKDAFFIFDEQRLVGGGAWVKAFYKIAASNHWIILSATPGDTWMDYIPVFVANGFYKNRTEFIRRHVVWNTFTKFPTISRYVETAELERNRRSVLVEMPLQRHTKRKILNVACKHDQEALDRIKKERWHVIENRPIKDVAEMFAVTRKVVNSDPSRMGAVMKLLEKHPKLIIFYNFDYELDILRSMVGILEYPAAEWNGHRHQPVPDGDRWVYLVQYTAGAEGWNCVATDAMTFYSLNYSWKVTEQSMGRIDRMNTPYTDLFYYRLRSGSWLDQAIMKALMGKKDFNERSYAKKVA